MDSRSESPAGILNPIAEEALHWVVRRLDNKAWIEADEAKLQAWRATAPEYDREFIRHEFIAKLISQPQAHRDEARQFQHEISAVPEDSKLLSEAKDLLKRAEAPGLPVAEVLSLLDDAILRFRLLIAPTHTRHRRLFAQVLMRRGNLRRATDGRKHLQEILQDYDEAETQLLVLLPDQNPSWRDDLADLCTQRGIALMSVGSPTTLPQALTCFDRAIEIRRPSLASGEFWDRYCLVAAWMNRGDVLSRLARFDEAAKAYDEAFTLMEGIPLGDQPLFRRRFVIACLNRGSIFLERNFPGDPELAAQSSDEALAVLRAAASDKPIEKMLAASAWANRAAAFARLNTVASVESARQSSREALSLVASAEGDDVHAAEAGIKARHALCVAVVKLITAKISAGLRETLVNEAMQAVNDGLRLCRAWEHRKVVRFQSLADELFNFGARLSELYQPHALGLYFLTHLDPRHTAEKSPWRRELRETALATVGQAIQRILDERLSTSGNFQVTDYFLDALKELRLAEARLRELTEE
jgi:tetratricopeptide (TPR) repeat protein